jgi:cold shock CspA family protein
VFFHIRDPDRRIIDHQRGHLVEYEMGHDKQGRPAAVNIRVL